MTSVPEKKLVGVVQDWDAARNFGWVSSDRALASDRALRRFFCHRDDTVGRMPLRVGQRVTFVASKTPRGPRALCVELIEPGSVAAEEGK
jgi:cold shock CspA family protein